MHCSDARVDHNIENALWMIAFFVGFTPIHAFYVVELTLHEDVIGLGSFSH